MKKRIEMELNAAGVLQNQGVHDASIIEITTSGEGDKIRAMVRCRTEQGQILSFLFEGVRIFNLSFFGHQNVVNDCIVMKSREARAELSEIKDLEINSFEKVDELNKKIKLGDLVLVRFIPSIGAAIDCISRTVALEID